MTKFNAEYLRDGLDEHWALRIMKAEGFQKHLAMVWIEPNSLEPLCICRDLRTAEMIASNLNEAYSVKAQTVKP